MTDILSPSYPVLPLRDIVVFPHMIVPLFVGREKSVRALDDNLFLARPSHQYHRYSGARRFYD